MARGKWLDWLFDLIILAMVAGLLAVVILEWAAGCGETYVDAEGQVHQYECLFR
jgi:hypothetical protein